MMESQLFALLYQIELKYANVILLILQFLSNPAIPGTKYLTCATKEWYNPGMESAVPNSV
jgi:hypothetical protein